MRPADIDRNDRRRLAASLAVTAFLYAVFFAASFAFGALLPAGGACQGRNGAAPISIRLAASGGTGGTGTARTDRTDSGSGGSRRAVESAAASPDPRSGDEPSGTVSERDRKAGEQESRMPAEGTAVGSAVEASDGGNGGYGRLGDSEGSGAGEPGRAGSGTFIGGTSGGTPAFVSWLDQAIRTKLAYPEKARNRKIEGTVTILAEVSADGKICIASVVQSSGSSILDRAAVSFVKSLFPSPVSPQKIFSGTLRIRYILRQEGT